ncbi:MAG TPA: peptide-methionine (R)-S-oxide reductase MsrB [Gemmatimonadaceae bacterium]|nr:peptide-methionine (R)-S-oxide reductase MsrB [Gemmatimonadaceae bacterium]
MAPLGNDLPTTRREFLAAAVLLAGGPLLVALRRAGAGAETEGPAGTMAHSEDVMIVEFSDTGARQRTVRVPKVVKPESEWRRQLSPLAFQVARRGDTERPFSGAYWDLHEKGIFRCVCCETALFGSAAKFDSGTGWPSFWQPIAKENVVTHPSRSARGIESELTCPRCDAHLGDVFDDGPPPTGLRYCIDSVSLRFVKFV